MKKSILTFFTFLLIIPAIAQEIPQAQYNLDIGDIEKWPKQMVRVSIHGPDTLVEINYFNIYITGDIKFPDVKQRATWDRIKNRVKKEYPYAILIGAKVKECDKQVEGMSEKAKKEYMDKVEKELKDEFESAFRGNSVEEARVLIKLVDRETGHTSHELIKRFRGGFSAFMWQSVALVCGTNLKSKYEMDGEDKLIEQAIFLVETGLI
ncbi:MAG TPA: DUF4294 domain-containing protein [Bacteroidia bacterium]|nr:DUF4294 domain-containing protein [Bacteroidia bacterium]